MLIAPSKSGFPQYWENRFLPSYKSVQKIVCFKRVKALCDVIDKVSLY